MVQHPSFQFDRRRFLGLAAGGVAASAAAAAPFAAFAEDAGEAPLKIATIGAGREGGALGTLFAKQGHPVMFSSQHPEQLKELVASAGPTAQAGTVEQAVGFGDVVLLVVPYTAVEQIGKDYGNALAAKQLVIDVSNPIARRDGEAIVSRVAEQGGAGLATAKMLPGAHLVRGFNAINYARLAAGRASTGRAGRRADRRRRLQRRRAGDAAHQGNRLRAGARRRAGDGQVSSAGNAARRRAYPGRDPADRRDPPVSGARRRGGELTRATPESGPPPLMPGCWWDGATRRNKGALQAFFQASPKIACLAPSFSKQSFGGFVGFQGVTRLPNVL